MSGQSTHQSIRDSIIKIVSLYGLEAMGGASVVNGFVQKIDKEAGTVDVVSSTGERIILGATLGAILGNKKGDMSYPVMSSEVAVLILNTAQSFVVSYTHLTDKVIEVNDRVYIGATGVKDQDDDTDYDETEVTDYKTFINFTPEEIRMIAASKDKESSIVQTCDKIVAEVDKTKVEQTENSVKTEVGNNTFLDLTENKANLDATQIVLGGSNAQWTVKGEDLIKFLNDLVKELTMVTTPTPAGAMPFVNLPNFIAMIPAKLLPVVSPLLSTKTKIE